MFTSYVLLVIVVAVGAFWIQKELDEADDDRCAILRVQIQLYADLYKDIGPPVDQNDIEALTAELLAVCPEG